jgi:hypothetical protein
MARVCQHVIRPPTEMLGADRPTTATAIKSRLADLKSIRIDQDRHPDLVFLVSATGIEPVTPRPSSQVIRRPQDASQASATCRITEPARTPRPGSAE